VLVVFRCGIAAAVVASLASIAFGATEGPGKTQTIRAKRTSRPPSIDGKLSEPEWQAAPLFDQFVQSFPDEGERPSERTEVRVLYDDDNLYVGIICFDSQPETISRLLGRRDRMPASDTLGLAIDSNHSHREALVSRIRHSAAPASVQRCP
jgi:hypothetical protein